MRRFALACLALLGGALAGYIVAENPPTRPAWAQGGAFGLTPSTAASISVTGTSSRVQLGASGTTILLQNTGTNDAFVAFGGSGVTATTSSHSLPAGKSIAYNAAASSYVAAITASSTTTVKISQGFGSTAVGGGGSGSGGGGGDVNVIEWAGDTLGAPSNYGTSPGAVAVPGVNAFVTNANTNGATTAANGSPIAFPTDQSASILATPSAATAQALTGVSCGSAVSSCVLKASAGNLYGVYANCTSACWVMVFNATSAPSNGATTAGNGSGNLVECFEVSAGSSKSLAYNYAPRSFSVGITATVSSTACASLTLSTVGFVSGGVK